MGIVNGTTNFILTRMADEGTDFATALAEAQELGYAEADPTADVTGADAASKASILASLAFATWVGARPGLPGRASPASRRSTWPSPPSWATRCACWPSPSAPVMG